MADLADVENQIKAILAAAIYPNGTSNPSAILQGATPVPTKIGRGWPLKNTLEADLAAGVANVSIFAQPGSDRNASRFPREYVIRAAVAPTLAATPGPTTVTISGTVSVPQNVAVKTNGQAFVYAVQANDTLSSIASALASLINVSTPAGSAGPVITIAGCVNLAAITGGSTTLIRELRRQERLFQICCWCNAPEQRDPVAQFVDQCLIGAGLDQGREFIALPDGSMGRLLYQRTFEIDKDELVGSFRRDFIWSVEYPTTDTIAATEVITIEADISPGPDLADATPPTIILTV